jgi:copper oxidase (laccase) domain-containing protein
MIDTGADVNNMIVAIGPCIRQNSYEVDQKFYENFMDNDEDNYLFFDKNDNYIKFDLPSYVKSKISNFGINNIEDCNINTYDDRRFPSHRKSTLTNQKYIGGILSVISLDD